MGRSYRYDDSEPVTLAEADWLHVGPANDNGQPVVLLEGPPPVDVAADMRAYLAVQSLLEPAAIPIADGPATDSGAATRKVRVGPLAGLAERCLQAGRETPNWPFPMTQKGAEEGWEAVLAAEGMPAELPPCPRGRMLVSEAYEMPVDSDEGLRGVRVDRVLFRLPAWVSGVLVAFHVEAGEVLRQGEVLSAETPKRAPGRPRAFDRLTLAKSVVVHSRLPEVYRELGERFAVPAGVFPSIKDAGPSTDWESIGKYLVTTAEGLYEEAVQSGE